MVTIRTSLLLLRLFHYAGQVLGLWFALCVLRYYSNHLCGPDSKFSFSGLLLLSLQVQLHSGSLRQTRNNRLRTYW